MFFTGMDTQWKRTLSLLFATKVRLLLAIGETFFRKIHFSAGTTN